MEFTLIISEPQVGTEEFCNLIKKVLGPSKLTALENFDGNFDECTAAALLFTPENGHIKPETVKFINEHAHKLELRNSALLCIEQNHDDALHALEEAAFRWGRSICYLDCIDLSAEQQEPGKYGYSSQVAEKLIYVKRRLNSTAEMPEAELMEEIQTVLLAHNTCTLCTGFSSHVRATPIEYTYWNGCFYFLSEGGEKFANLAVNPQVSIAVYNAYNGFSSLESIQVEGKSQEIEAFSSEYMDILNFKGLPVPNLKTLPVQLNLIKVEPERFEILKSDFTQKGYSAKQVVSIPPKL